MEIKLAKNIVEDSQRNFRAHTWINKQTQRTSKPQIINFDMVLLNFPTKVNLHLAASLTMESYLLNITACKSCFVVSFGTSKLIGTLYLPD